MAKLFNPKRAFFPKGKQREFIDRIAVNLSIQEMARICGLSERTIRDWRREKFSIDSTAIYKLCKKSGTPFPKNIRLKDRYWYTSNGSSAGGMAVFKKYGRVGGDPEYRKKKWYEWWAEEGKYKQHPIINKPLPIKEPKKSKDLAEFVGIVLGDGGIAQRQVVITLHSKDDRDYSEFVIRLIKRLFSVPIGINYDKKYLAVDLTISRTELVRFCVKKLGLKQGNKIEQQVDIPRWIKQNKQYAIACMRGLMDTDGCVFSHHYKSKGKWYNYKKLSFTSYSNPLRQSVFNILKDNGFKPRFAQRKDVRLDSKKDIQRYFEFVGSHNPKYLRKYQK